MTRPRPARVRRALYPVLVAVMAGLFSGCGDPVVGGHGALSAGAGGTPAVLVLEGSAYQMGWWHGHLLRDRIEALHERWQRIAIQSQVGLAHDLDKGAAGDLKETIELFVDQTLARAPERIRQELEGIAAGSGVPIETLLFTEVMRDGLRIWLKQMEPRMPGAIAAVATGPEVRAWWTGPDTDVLRDEWLVVLRRPLGGPESVLVSWPGSVGGIAGFASSGLGVVFCEAEVDGDMRGFGGGVPYPIGARMAIESGSELDRMRAEIDGTAGHALVALSLPLGADDEAEVVGSIEVYRGIQDELRLGDSRFLVLGPWQSVHAARRRAKLGHDAADGTVFERARSLVETSSAHGASCVIRRDDRGWQLLVAGAPGSPALTFRFDGNGIARE